MRPIVPSSRCRPGIVPGTTESYRPIVPTPLGGDEDGDDWMGEPSASIVPNRETCR